MYPTLANVLPLLQCEVHADADHGGEQRVGEWRHDQSHPGGEQ